MDFERTISFLLMKQHKEFIRKTVKQVKFRIQPLHGFTTEQLQQLSRALSMLSTSHSAGNKNTYVNATCLSPFFDDSINSF